MAKAVRKERWTQAELIGAGINPGSVCESCKGELKHHEWMDLSPTGIATHCNITEYTTDAMNSFQWAPKAQA